MKPKRKKFAQNPVWKPQLGLKEIFCRIYIFLFADTQYVFKFQLLQIKKITRKWNFFFSFIQLHLMAFHNNYIDWIYLHISQKQREE